ncbi:MAG: hypothetical protein Q9174_003234 [Haloplaca sp. 1 TL-2023]
MAGNHKYTPPTHSLRRSDYFLYEGRNAFAMSRRTPNPAAERATQNQQTIKTLLKLEENKSCADCKRNKRTKACYSILESLLTMSVLILTQTHDGQVGISVSLSAFGTNVLGEQNPLHELMLLAARAYIEEWARISAGSNLSTSMPGRTSNCKV